MQFLVANLQLKLFAVEQLQSVEYVKAESYILNFFSTRIFRFAEFILCGRVEKTNKSEIRNRLTYRVLIHIFEVGMKTFFLK